MTRKQALAVIRAEVAEHGECTRAAMRAYVENRVGRAAFNKAMAVGMQIHRGEHRFFSKHKPSCPARVERHIPCTCGAEPPAEH